jgi:hypothetical protein
MGNVNVELLDVLLLRLQQTRTSNNHHVPRLHFTTYRLHNQTLTHNHLSPPRRRQALPSLSSYTPLKASARPSFISHPASSSQPTHPLSMMMMMMMPLPPRAHCCWNVRRLLSGILLVLFLQIVPAARDEAVLKARLSKSLLSQSVCVSLSYTPTHSPLYSLNHTHLHLHTYTPTHTHNSGIPRHRQPRPRHPRTRQQAQCRAGA